jgi:hypothetical protein
MKKSQVSLELIIYVSIMLIMFGIAIITANNRQQNIHNERVFADAKNLLNEIATEIDIAVAVGNGYSDEFSLPEMLADGANYSININKQYQIVYIEWLDKNYSLPIVTSNINGSVSKGKNKISNGGGMITIERSASF